MKQHTWKSFYKHIAKYKYRKKSFIIKYGQNPDGSSSKLFGKLRFLREKAITPAAHAYVSTQGKTADNTRGRMRAGRHGNVEGRGHNDTLVRSKRQKCVRRNTSGKNKTREDAFSSIGDKGWDFWILHFTAQKWPELSHPSVFFSYFLTVNPYEQTCHRRTRADDDDRTSSISDERLTIQSKYSGRTEAHC